MFFKTLSKTLILSCVLSAAILAAGSSFADINSPQGALDVAAMVPGQYGFLAANNSTVEVIASESASRVEAPVKTDVDSLLAMAREATDREVAKMRGGEQLSLASELARALDVAAAVPKDAPKKPVAQVAKAPAPRSARELIKSRAFLWPVDGNIYSAFNATRGKNRKHGAVDIVAPKGTPVAAAADGTVAVVANGGKSYRGYGKIVIVDHGSGVRTVYAHLSSFAVKTGQSVKAGQVIGGVGRTGTATSDLLHYEVRVDGKKIDPLTVMEHRPGVVKMVNYKSPKTK